MPVWKSWISSVVCSRHNSTIQPLKACCFFFFKVGPFLLWATCPQIYSLISAAAPESPAIQVSFFLPLYGLNCSCSFFSSLWLKTSSRSCHEGENSLWPAGQYNALICHEHCSMCWLLLHSNVALPWQFSRQLSFCFTTSVLAGSKVTAWQGGL